ncbi:Ninjurin-1-like 1, partial [Homarus americanus]
GGKRLDANNYATKKTVAQGMLDVALLTANASQLKYVLEVGEKHPYYTAMIILISFSLVLQRRPPGLMTMPIAPCWVTFASLRPTTGLRSAVEIHFSRLKFCGLSQYPETTETLL